MEVRKNLSWAGFAQAFSFILNFISVIVVSRVLTPQEVGIYSVSVAVIGISHILRDFGVGQYLVQLKIISREKVRAAFTVTLLTSWSIALVIFTLREPMARLYEFGGIADVLMILCLNFVVLPFGTPIVALLQRDLQFNLLAVNTILSTLVQTSVTITCVFMGESYLSMAWGALAAASLKVAWLNLMRPGALMFLPSTKGVKEVLGFGSLASTASTLRELGEMAPELILGKTLGFVDVAFFSRAKGLQKMLMSKIHALVESVYFPTFAQQLRKGEDGARLYCQSMLYVTAISAPILGFLAVVAEPLILFLFGEQWTRAAPLATILCCYALISTPFNMYSISLVASGNVKAIAKVQAMVLVVKLGVLSTSILLPLKQVVLLLGLTHMVQIALLQNVVKQTFNLSLTTLLLAIKPSLILVPLTLLGPICTLMSMDYVGLTAHPFWGLLLASITALAGWLIGVHAIDHVIKLEFYRIIKYARTKLDSIYTARQ